MNTETSRILVRLMLSVAGLGVLGVGAWYGYGTWTKYVAKKEIEAAGLTYSEASFIQQAGNGNQAAVLLFLKSGMPINTRGPDDGTALHCAARNRKADLLKFLVEHGADVNAANKYGQTPIIEAAKSGDIELSTKLLSAGANVNAADATGKTPLLWAAGSMCLWGSCKTDLVELLLAHGADPKARTSSGENTISTLIESSNAAQESQLIPMIDRLIQSGADANAMTGPAYGGQPLLVFLAGSGKSLLVGKLVTSGADVNAKGKNSTPLVAAVRWPDEIKILLDAKADPNLPDASGNTPLVVAARQRLLETAKLLLGAGANPNLESTSGEGPIHAAAKQGDLDMVELLTKFPLDLEARDAEGQTALHVLARYSSAWNPGKRAEIAKMLIKLGANRNARNRQSQTPAEVALNSNSVDLASVLAGRKLTAKMPAQAQPRYDRPQPIVISPQVRFRSGPSQ